MSAEQFSAEDAYQTMAARLMAQRLLATCHEQQQQTAAQHAERMCKRSAVVVGVMAGAAALCWWLAPKAHEAETGTVVATIVAGAFALDYAKDLHDAEREMAKHQQRTVACDSALTLNVLDQHGIAGPQLRSLLLKRIPESEWPSMLLHPLQSEDVLPVPGAEPAAE